MIKKIIGLTGNIATGKSTVMQILMQLGATTIDADRVVHQLYAENQPLVNAICLMFGQEVIGADGKLDRPKLGQIVFADRQKMRQLEIIVHPVVQDEVRRQIDVAVSSCVVIEAIKLLESPIRQLCDSIWVTTCSAETQIERLINHRHLSRQDAELRVMSQPPQLVKINQADVVIDTNGTLIETKDQVVAQWTQLFA